ncbi:hypothetical protein [Amnibacterium kyonggiense]
MPSAPHCPVCGSDEPRRLVYGLVTAEVLDDPGVAHGGCSVGPDAARRRCRNTACEAEYGRLGRRP